MKVSILGTLPPIRALSSYCFELTSSMVKKCRVEFISFHSIYPSFLYPGGTPDDDHTYPAINDQNLQIRRNLSWYNPMSWIAEGFAAGGDILHAQWWSAPLFPVYLFLITCYKMKKKPVVFTVHNVLSHENSSLYFLVSKLLHGLGDHFIVHSRLNAEQLMRFYHIPKHKISIIPHGSLDFHVRKDVDCNRLKAEFGIGINHKIILMFGAIRPYKGVDVAIKAFAEVLKAIPEARLLIAGRAWEDWRPYEQLASRLGISKQVLKHLDYIPSGDVHKFFEIADLCIFPYHHFDSQSGAASVAVSFRKPIIVSNVGGLPDFVKNRRWVVPPGDPDRLARAMVSCLNEPGRMEAMRQDTEEMANRFSWEAISDQTIKIYRMLLDK